MEPLVSVIIPTHRRPDLVVRAIHSALVQTLNQIEVIVVVDGPDEATQQALAAIDDPRLKIVLQSTNQGCAASRRTGVEVAQAPWIAYLDDDDEWMPQKLEQQLTIAQHSRYQFPIVSCYVKFKTSTEEHILPRRLPMDSEPLSEYLFVRNSLFQGEGLIQTSTIFTAKELLQRVPSRKQRHDDWDWLLRATACDGVGIEFVYEPLAIWNLGGDRQSISRAKNWQYSLDWIREQRHLVTAKAYSSFLLTEVSAKASASQDWKVFWLLAIEALRLGQPRLKDFGLHFGMWLLSPSLRRKIRTILAASKPQQPSSQSLDSTSSI